MASASVKKQKKNIRKHRLISYVLTALCIYLLVCTVSTQLRIFNRQQELAELRSSIRAQEEANDEINRVISGSSDSSDYIEKIARDKLGYGGVDERVFIDVAGIG